MTKPVATAKVNYLTGSSWPDDTRITKSRGHFHMYAPGWRPMNFSTLEAAKAKLERHPGFIGWII